MNVLKNEMNTRTPRICNDGDNIAIYTFASNPRYIFRMRYDKSTWIYTHPAYLHRLTIFLRLDHNVQCKVFIDLFATDYPHKDRRIRLVYQLLSVKYNRRMLLQFSVKETEWVPSIVQQFRAASWYEREVRDLYGILFSENNDMRRILTDYGFRGHPGRRDFPVSGFSEIRYDEKKRTLIYTRIRLTQEFRDFHVTMPWKYFYKTIPNFQRIEEAERKLDGYLAEPDRDAQTGVSEETLPE